MFQKLCLAVLLMAAIGHQDMAHANHVPQESQYEIDTNLVSCLMAVDDAESAVRSVLQSTCIGHLGRVCTFKMDVYGPSKSIGCFEFEAQRTLRFLEASIVDLPATLSLPKNGFFELGYERRYKRILEDIASARSAPKPGDLKSAVDQMVRLASTAIDIFYMAEKTGVPLGPHVDATMDDH